MDPLSDVLSLLNARSVLSAGLLAGGDWAMRFPAYEGIKFSAIVRGSCWLAVDGVAQPIPLHAGDCYLLTDGRSYRLGSDLSLDAVDAREVFARAVGGVARHGDTFDLRLIGGRFDFDEANAAVLLDTLPPVVHVAAASGQAAIILWVLEQLAAELATPQTGATLMADHLAHIMLLQVLRAYLASDEHHAAGWLGALSDSKIGAAIRLMHQDPARRWTLADLAAAAGMSRSAFALRFKSLVGTAPLDYLLRWRMRLAVRALRSGGKTVSSVALSLGYGSESAFSNAFKRIMGSAPAHYRALAGRPSMAVA